MPHGLFMIMMSGYTRRIYVWVSYGRTPWFGDGFCWSYFFHLLENAALKHGASYVRTKTFGTESTLTLIYLMTFDIVTAVHPPKCSPWILCHYDFKLPWQVSDDEGNHFGRYQYISSLYGIACPSSRPSPLQRLSPRPDNTWHQCNEATLLNAIIAGAAHCIRCPRYSFRNASRRRWHVLQ